MASLSYEQPSRGLQERHRSQSDSNLLSSNGVSEPVMIRTESASDLSPTKHTKKKGFLHKLVRPWKWKKKRKGKSGSVHYPQGWLNVIRIMGHYSQTCYCGHSWTPL